MARGGSVVSHWHTLIDGFNTSGLDFYRAIEDAVRAREVPDVKFSRVEFKEGGFAPAKREYLRIEREIGALTVAYIDRDQSVPVPGDWDVLRRSLEERIVMADQALMALPPTAIPSAECRHCPVRQMCDEYWQSSHAVRDASSPFGDVEVDVLAPNGPKSWFVSLSGASGQSLLRTATEVEEFEVGQRLRVLNVAITETEDDNWTVVTINARSEIFSIVPS